MQIAKWLLLSVPLTLGGITSKLASRPPELSCVVAARWVKEHPAELPTSLDAFSKFSPDYQKAIYVALPESAHSQLWHEQFQRYAKLATLSDVQKEFILDTDKDRALYLVKTAEGEKLRVDHGLRGKAILGDSLYAVIFSNLGARGTTGAVASKLRSEEPEYRPCHCWIANEVQDCTNGQQCHYPSGGCVQVQSCGPFWCTYCDGKCFG